MIAAFWIACGGGDGTSAPGMSIDPGSEGPSGSGPSGTTAPGSASTKPGSPSPGSSEPGSSSGAPNQPGEKPAMQPPQGATEFVSADDSSASSGGVQGRAGAAGGGVATAAPPTAAPAPGVPSSQAADSAGGATASPRAVERGDIYRVLGDGRILNLNQYRGVQIIDVRDVNQPRVEGRYAVAGQPVELYVVGDRAIVLLNNWQGYYGSREDVQVEQVSGGVVISVDIHDRAHPTLIAQAPVPGNLSTSRLTQGGAQAALYVAATNYQQSASTVVKSFDVSDGKLSAKSELDLGGYVQDIQATTDVLMVASNDYSKSQGRSQVSVIDISSPDGTMVKGGTVLAQGVVQNKFNMDAYNGVLRIVSGANWNGVQTNAVETFDLKDKQRLAPLSRCNFGNRAQDGTSEMLYATIFVENKGFFVTYYRRDPFHAFSIDDQGRCQEHNEFIVSGWNDFLRPTLGDTRLVGIGRNDANSTLKLSVSLYDAENLSNPSPLKARADIDLQGSYSEASWDDRAFSVIEDAVSAQAADGTTEAGLILLPFQGWDQKSQTQLARVQLFTFSDHTLTKRATLDHGTPVRRSFLSDASTTANLSEEELSLFTTSNPDQPKENGRVELAPNYRNLFVYGDYVARLKDRSYYFSYPAANQSSEPPKADVQIVPRSGDVDGGSPVASFQVPAGADLIQVGELLVSVQTTTTYDPNGKAEPKYDSTLSVFDLSDPTQPKARGSLQTDRIVPSYGYYYPTGPLPPVAVARPGVGIADCFDCGGLRPYAPNAQRYVVGDAIAFAHVKSQQKSVGWVTQCYKYAPAEACASDISCPKQYISGGITCTTPRGGAESCSGGFYQCDLNGNCQPIDPPRNLQTSCNDYEQFRYWQSWSFDPLDLRNPDQPAMANPISLPEDEEGSSVLANQSTLYFNFAKPISVKNDPRNHVKHYVRLLDFGDPQNGKRGEPVNVPGDVIAVDANTLYARDLVWTDTAARTLVSRLTLDGGLAYLQASRLFQDRSVDAVKLDGAGHMLVSNAPALTFPQPAGQIPPHELAILDDQSLEIAGSADVDSWATFKDAQAGRALFQVSGGLLVFDVSDAAAPKAQAYFPSQGWPNEIYFDGKDILFAAGPYGIYRFDASTFNLLSK